MSKLNENEIKTQTEADGSIGESAVKGYKAIESGVVG